MDMWEHKHLNLYLIDSTIIRCYKITLAQHRPPQQSANINIYQSIFNIYKFAMIDIKCEMVVRARIHASAHF